MKKLIAFALFLISHTALAEVSTPVSGTLPNGLNYTILPLHDEKGRLEIRLRVNAGGVDETDAQAGVAHMVEHLTFRGSDKHPDGVMNHLHDLGFVRARHYNAVTTIDSTTYMMTPPAKVGLDESLSALSQMMFFATITPADLDKERHIIMEEWRGGRGVGAVMDEQRKAVIRADSRYIRSPVIGTEHSIRTMPAYELQDFYHTWYAPNNMNLLIVGDTNVDNAKAKINEYFGGIPSKNLPDRTGDYYEVKLSDRLVVKELHDDRSGVSQVAYITRFDESGSRGDSNTARKNRLIDRMALTFITRRLQNEMPTLPDGIKSLVARKSDIGKNTVALGIFSSVDKDSHKDGLARIFTEMRRLETYPISQAEFDEIKTDLQRQIDKAFAHDNDRDFSGWVQAMVGTTLVGKPYFTQNEVATFTQPILDTLTPADIQARVHDWLTAHDRIVQYQAPHSHRVTPISEHEVMAMMDKANTDTPTPPTQKAVVQAIDLPDVTPTAHITGTRTHHSGKVHEYTLSTGERVLWLSHPSAKQKTYIRAVNGAGTQADSLNAWQSQLATQLIAQSTPDEFSQAEMDEYKKAHKLSLSYKQDAHQLIIDMNTDNAQLGELIKLYHAQTYRTIIKDDIGDVKASLYETLAPTDTRKQLEQSRTNKIATLRQLPTNLPTSGEIDRLRSTDLQHQWHAMTHTPATFYVLSNADDGTMADVVTLLANPNPNLNTLSSYRTPLAMSGADHLNYHKENRTDVQLWTSTPYIWQGTDAMLVSLVKNIAADKLKLAMRDEKLGIYKLSFDSTLNADDHQIQSHLKFTTSPDKVDDMTTTAKQVLTNLPNLITAQDVTKAKSTFITQEKSRQDDPNTWLNRLVLSDKASDDLAYLSKIDKLADHITLDNLRRIASSIYHADSTQVWADMPEDSPKQ